MRAFWIAAVLGVLALCPVQRLRAAGSDDIIPATVAEQHGLQRRWVAQVQLDRGRARVRDMILCTGGPRNEAHGLPQDILYIQTTRAVLHAIDAETGQTLWAKQLGRPDHPSLTPSGYRDLVATVNGSRLFVMNRYNGEVMFESVVNGAPGGGPALAGRHAYVPMVSGMVMAYCLDPIANPKNELGIMGKKPEDMTEEEKKAEEEERRQNIRINTDYVPPLACQSTGRALVQPLGLPFTLQNDYQEMAVWGTDRGYLNVGSIDRPHGKTMVIKYRLLTGEGISATPSYLAPDPEVPGDVGTIFFASRDGYVYALLEKTGELLWKFSAGEPIDEPTAAIEDRVYAAVESGGMFCLDAKKGKQLWWAADIVRFLAASKHKVYAADKVGRLQILDARSGSRLDSIPTERLPIKMVNGQTDRIYLASDTGLVQCFHEMENETPIVHGDSRKLPYDKEYPAPVAKVVRGKVVAAEPHAKCAKSGTATKTKTTKKAKAADDGQGFDAGGADDMPGPKTGKKTTTRPKTGKAKKGKDDAEPDNNNPFGGGGGGGGAGGNPFGG